MLRASATPAGGVGRFTACGQPRAFPETVATSFHLSGCDADLGGALPWRRPCNWPARPSYARPGRGSRARCVRRTILLQSTLSVPVGALRAAARFPRLSNRSIVAMALARTGRWRAAGSPSKAGLIALRCEACALGPTERALLTAVSKRRRQNKRRLSVRIDDGLVGGRNPTALLFCFCEERV
jgi:hypothetical protein